MSGAEPPAAEIHVLTGDRAGLRVSLAGGECILGRNADCTLRFASRADGGVSARHARFALGPRGWVLHDLGSTNHTWLNGHRVRRPAALRDGDLIVLGAGGPTLRVRLATPRRALAWWGLARGALAAACVAGGAMGLHLRPWRHEIRPPPVASPRRPPPGARAPSPGGRSAAEPRAAARESTPTAPPVPRTMPADARARGNRLAVARIWVEGDRGRVWTGTAAAVRADGTLVTSRHVVRGDGESARRIAVQFTASAQVWRARVIAVSRDWDLALVRVDGIDGAVPTVGGLNLRPDTIVPGSPVVFLGFPGGGAVEPGRPAWPARSTGAFAAFHGRVEVHARSAAGASGSPLIDTDGNLLGVLFGGNPRAPRPVVYAVPAVAVARLMEIAP